MPPGRTMNATADTSRAFAGSEFRHLLRHLASKDYGVTDCLVQNREQAPRTISFRYDVHLRDVHCAHGFLDVHCERGVPGTFFLLHAYALVEQAHEADFVELANRIGAAKGQGVPVELGLHDSPVDRYLTLRFADGDEGRYVAWLRNSDSVAFFRKLNELDSARSEFDAEVLAMFVQTVRLARQTLGDFQLSAGHGGSLS